MRCDWTRDMAVSSTLVVFSDSLMRGWELICICLYYFPPNKVFRDPLHAYLTTRSETLSVALAPSTPASSAAATAASAPTTDTASALRPGPSLAAAAALAAGSDPAGLIPTAVTPAFGVPLADNPRTVGGGGGANTPEATTDSAPSTEFPYGPWVKLSALHFTRAAPRWFMRSVAVGAVRASTPPSKEELIHVKVKKKNLKKSQGRRGSAPPFRLSFLSSPQSQLM